MNKAFTKETDEEEEPERPESAPLEVRNFMTPTGFAALQQELRDLLQTERPKVVTTVSWAASNGDRSENADYIYGKRRLREIDRRIRYLTKRLENAEVIDPLQQKNLTKIYFGAIVTYSDSKNNHITVQLVGPDEADLKLHKISWFSPVAKALLRAEVGAAVIVHTPAGKEEELLVLEIKYCI